PDGQGEDALGVVAARGRQVRQLDTERALAGGAVVTGVDHLEDTRPVADQTAEVVQGALGNAVAVAGVATARAGPAAMAARPLTEKVLGEVFDTGNAFGAIRDVLPRSRPHDRLLRWGQGQAQKSRWPRRSQEEPAFLATLSAFFRFQGVPRRVFSPYLEGRN